MYVPSLPGFIFSSPLTKAGVDVREIAKLWNTLMTKSLVTRNFVLMEEIEALVTAHLAHEFADSIIGAHMS